MPRFYDPQSFSAHVETPLADAAAHHAANVLRMQAGDELTLFNGQGGEWQARILSISKKQVVVVPLTFDAINRTSLLAIHLWLPLIKGERLDWALQKATEMGAASIQLYTSERTEVRLNAERLDKKLNQWQSILIGACEQSGLNLLPALHAPQPLAKLWDTASHSCRLIALPNPPNGIATWQQATQQANNILLLTGPEGGFSPQEEACANTHHFIPFTLGERVLRAETAPIALMAALYARAAVN